MVAEIISIGDELLIGQVVNTNSVWMAESLNGIGIAVVQITSIPDRAEAIIQAMDQAGNMADIILITGGLGPTRDDITKNVLAGYFGGKLIRNEEALVTIREFLGSRGVEMNELNLGQAMVPDNCTVIPNRWGTAPGMWFRKGGRDYISMPGVPYEMKGMMTGTILPELRKKYNLPVIIHRTIVTQGIPESHLARMLEKYEDELPADIRLAYLPSPGMVRLRLSTTGKDREKTESLINKELERLLSIVSDHVVSTADQKLEKIIGELLVERASTLSLAESCTGGMIAHLITSVPGSSRYFMGSVVAYSNDIKEKIVGVSAESLARYGAVSEQVVSEMAAGALRHFNTDYSVATSGIAGPDGGTMEKPVGLVWIAVASREKIITEKFNFGNQRDTNIQRASITALNMLRKLMLNKK
jgi:competence/damage-inducible protein CinA-like protein